MPQPVPRAERLGGELLVNEVGIGQDEPAVDRRRMKLGVELRHHLADAGEELVAVELNAWEAPSRLEPNAAQTRWAGRQPMPYAARIHPQEPRRRCGVETGLEEARVERRSASQRVVGAEVGGLEVEPSELENPDPLRGKLAPCIGAKELPLQAVVGGDQKRGRLLNWRRRSRKEEP